MTKQTTLRIDSSLAEQVDLVARAQEKSANQFIVDAIAAEVERVKGDASFMDALRAHILRDKEILDELAK